MDLQPDPATSVLGLAFLQREGLPPLLGIPQPIPAKPSGPLTAEHCGLALTLGPAYKESDGQWAPLAGLPVEWSDISHEVINASEDGVEFEVEYRVGGGPTLWERYRLRPDGLRYETRLRWVVGGFRLQVPAFLTDGRLAAVPRLEGHRLRVPIGDHAFTVVAEDEGERWEIDSTPYASPWGVYQNIYLQSRSAVEYAVQVTLD